MSFHLSGSSLKDIQFEEHTFRSCVFRHHNEFGYFRVCSQGTDSYADGG